MWSTMSKALLKLSTRPLLATAYDLRMFANREEAIDQCMKVISLRENALIVGERGAGKTSLINYLVFKLGSEKRNLPVYINFFEYGENFTQKTFLESMLHRTSIELQKREGKRFSKKFLEAISKVQIDFLPITIERKKDSSVLSSTLERLKNIADELAKQNYQVTYFLDNTDKVDPQGIWSSLRGIRDTLWAIDVSFFFSLLPSQVDNVLKPPLDHFIPFVIRLKPLSPRGVKEMIQKRIKSSESAFSREVIDEIYKRSQGNPRIALHLSRLALDSALSRKETLVLPEHMSKSVLIQINRLSLIQRNVISYLLEHPGTSASNEDFAKEIGVGRSRLSQILNELVKAGILNWSIRGRRKLYHVEE